MEIHYYEGWFRAKKCPIGPLTPGTALACYEKKTLFTAVAFEAAKATTFLEFNKDYVGVGFLDESLREYLSYTFVEVEPGKLFLNEATHREYGFGTDTVTSGSTYYFKSKGQVVVVYEDLTTGYRSSTKQSCDVTGNWDAYPPFGEYAS
ncbi:MAG: hypothetical protein ACRC7O_03400, partial [Fimbriiglobus sp.]